MDQHTATFEEHRPFLTKLASRIIGDWSDAEDLVNHAFVRWQKIDLDEVTNARALLATIVSRLALNQKSSARMRHEVVIEPVIINRLKEATAENIDSLSDALSDAVEIVLSRLSPVERAVFLLREVFQFEYTELSELLNETEANCRQILKRARDKINAREPRFRPKSDVCELALERFLNASRSGNIEELMDVVAPEIVLVRDAGDIGLPQPAALHGHEPLLDHVHSYLQRHPGATWSCRQMGQGYQIALLTEPSQTPLCAFICAIDPAKIRRVDHITCPTRLGLLLNLVGGAQ